MQDVGAKELTHRAAKINVSHLVARQTIPTAVIPWTSDQVIQVFVVSFFEDLVRLDWTIKIFLIPPSIDVHDGYRRLLELTGQRLLLPELIVIGMRNKVIPGWYLAVEVESVSVGERSKPQVPLVSIVSIEFKVSRQI